MTGTATPEFDAVILAGGRGARMSGARKPELLVQGRSLLEHAVTAAASAQRIVVVGPPDLAVPESVVLTREDPPFSGPVAALAAGLSAFGEGGLRRSAVPEWLLLLAADLPGVRDAVGALLATDWTADGTYLTDPDGQAQWLAGIYRRSALESALAELPTPAGAALHTLLRPLNLRGVPVGAVTISDVDTWADLNAAQNAVIRSHTSK